MPKPFSPLLYSSEIGETMSEESKNFNVKLVWKGDKLGELAVLNKPIIKTGSPTGDGDTRSYHSPEDLFVASATVCYMNGFVEFTRKMRINFKSFECDSTGILEKVGRSYEITKIEMRARVIIDTEELRGRIDRSLELAAKYCFVGNSMKCPITHDSEIVTE